MNQLSAARLIGEEEPDYHHKPLNSRKKNINEMAVRIFQQHLATGYFGKKSKMAISCLRVKLKCHIPRQSRDFLTRAHSCAHIHDAAFGEDDRFLFLGWDFRWVCHVKAPEQMDRQHQIYSERYMARLRGNEDDTVGRYHTGERRG
jgi:hypothetical protein